MLMNGNCDLFWRSRILIIIKISATAKNVLKYHIHWPKTCAKNANEIQEAWNERVHSAESKLSINCFTQKHTKKNSIVNQPYSKKPICVWSEEEQMRERERRRFAGK